MPDNRFALLSCLTLSVLLSGCEQGKAPSSSQEVARQGAYSVQFSHSGQHVMVGSLHHGGSLWSLAPFERRYDWNHVAEGYSNLTSSAFSPDDQFIATTDLRTIVLWQLESGEAVWYWNAPGDIEDIALGPNGDFALLAMQDYTATLFDSKNGGILRRLAHDGIVYDVSLSSNGLLAASASDDLTARVWNLQSGEQLQSFEHANQVRTAELSANGDVLFTSAMSSPGKLWDVRSGKLLHELGNTRGHFSAARFDENSRQLLTGTTSGLVSLWDVSTGKRLQQWHAEQRDSWVNKSLVIEDVAFIAGGYRAAGANGLVFELQ
jgi:WD40 repeat protein